MNKTWLILDCNYLCHRAKHSIGGLSYGGTPTGVIYGFLRSLPSLQNMGNFFKDTSHFVFCWDSTSSKREEIFSDYKKSRRMRHKEWAPEEKEFENAFRNQMKRLRTMYLRTIGFRNIFWQKGYESDDIIASICLHIDDNDEAIIVTSDQDLYQCIRSNVSCYNPQTNKTLTLQGFKKRYDILPKEWAVVKIIAGCSTDEVPGVPGVGEKTAIKYLTGELDKHTKTFKKIATSASFPLYARNRKLIKLPMEGTHRFRLQDDELSEEGWRQVTKLLGMRSIRDRMPFYTREKEIKK